MRRYKKSTKQVFIAIMVTILVTAIAFCTVYFVFVGQVKERYQGEIDLYEDLIQSNQQFLYVAKEKIAAGEVIKEENLMYQQVFTGLDTGAFISKEDIGKTALIPINENVPIYKNMVSEILADKDLREEEFNVFYLSSNLKENDYIDLRIIYPNGEDYSVLSKKAVKGLALEEGKCYLWLDSEEILRISGAIVDAYLNEGSKLYTVKYVEPLIQEETKVTYIPNVNVITLIKNDPNVVNVAAQSLSEEVRAGLDDRLTRFYRKTSGSISWGNNQVQQPEDQDKDHKAAEEEENYYIE